MKDKGMLKSWSIKNFKPIVDSGELRLTPVTVLAGRNSSGKSSLLQSILMVAQTLGSRLLDRPLLPNERLVQLGTFEDILSETGHSRTLEFTFGLDMREEKVLTPSSRLRASYGSITAAQIFTSQWGMMSAWLSATFSSAVSGGVTSSAIEASKVGVEHVRLEVNARSRTRTSQSVSESQSQKVSLDLQKMGDDDVRRFLEHVAPEQRKLLAPAGESYLGSVMRANDSVQQQEEDLSKQYIVTLSHFLPARFTRKYKMGERRKQAIERYLHSLFSDINPPHALERFAILNAQTPIPAKLRDMLDLLCTEHGIDTPFSGQTLEELVRWTEVIPKTRRKKKVITDIQKITTREFLNSADDDQDIEGLEFVHDLYLAGMEQAIEQITAFFTSRIRYLGPLRADPQASQKFGPSSELDDVGSKGEFAAAVYDANYEARIAWYNPRKKQVEEGRLWEAVDCWAHYLGIAWQIRTEMAGLSGVAWKVVAREGRKPRSLSEVGVGISQILPILVMGLLSPANSLLIIEQPELHLHPSVQARLGDFFMGLARCEKQCLIETHSENLVSQLRLHIVEAGGLEESDCIVYFVDQDENGAATFEKIDISPNGNIVNWPDGFFDETMLQEDRITAESVRKRARDARHGS